MTVLFEWPIYTGLFILRHRVVAMPAPWVAAANSFHRQPEAIEGTMLFESFQRILAAGRRISAFGPKPRRNNQLVKTYENNKGKGKHLAEQAWPAGFVGRRNFVTATLHACSSTTFLSLLMQ